MWAMLYKLSKRAWSPAADVFENAGRLAAVCNCHRNYIADLQDAAVEQGILEDTGKKSRLGFPIFRFNADKLKEFERKANTLEDALEQEMKAMKRKYKNDPEDLEEERRMYEAEDMESGDQSTEDEGYNPALEDKVPESEVGWAEQAD
jgi:hypothetical protein